MPFSRQWIGRLSPAAPCSRHMFPGWCVISIHPSLALVIIRHAVWSGMQAGPADTGHFDVEFTCEVARLTPPPHSPLDPADQALFESFSYTADWLASL